MQIDLSGNGTVLRWTGFVLLMVFTSYGHADKHEFDALAMARSSIAHLENASSIAANIQVAEEAVLSSGIKIKTLREGTVLLQRTKGSHGFVFTRKGALVDQTMAYDGEALYMVGNKVNAVASVAASGDLDEVMDNMVAAGAYLPGRDLLYTDAAEGLLEDVLEATYGGLMPVNGEQCHYLMFRGPDVDWHLWVDAESELPCKYQVTSKWMTAAPEFEMDFHDWELNSDVDTSQFKPMMPEQYDSASEFGQINPKY